MHKYVFRNEIDKLQTKLNRIIQQAKNSVRSQGVNVVASSVLAKKFGMMQLLGVKCVSVTSFPRYSTDNVKADNSVPATNTRIENISGSSLVEAQSWRQVESLELWPWPLA